MQFWHWDLEGKENIFALVESGDHKKEKFDTRRELPLLEERGKRRECELGEREREGVGTTRREGNTNYEQSKRHSFWSFIHLSRNLSLT